MPRRRLIENLPDAVKAELHRRLYAANFGQTVPIGQWLTAKGYPVSKSAVYEYAMANVAAISAEVRDARVLRTKRGSQLADIRLRCLEAAARRGNAGSILDRASTLVAWVLGAPADPEARTAGAPLQTVPHKRKPTNKGP
jgi:hypothetical protein